MLSQFIVNFIISAIIMNIIFGRGAQSNLNTTLNHIHKLIYLTHYIKGLYEINTIIKFLLIFLTNNNNVYKLRYPSHLEV